MSNTKTTTTASGSKVRARANGNDDDDVAEAVGVSAAELTASKPKKSKKKSTATPAEEKVKTHDESAVKARTEKLPQVAAKNAALFKSLFNRDYAAKFENLERPFPEEITCISCVRPIVNTDPQKVMVFSDFPLDPEKRVYIHKDCVLCHAVVNPATGQACGFTNVLVAASSNGKLPARVQFDRRGQPVCCNHADDHALDVPTYSENDADGMIAFLNKYGFVKVTPDGERALTGDQCAVEHDRVLHGFAVIHGIPFDEFKTRTSQQDNWACSYINDTQLQESCMFGIFGALDENELSAPFVQSQEAYAVRGRFLNAFSKHLYDPDHKYVQTYSSGPCPYILMAKEHSSPFPVSCFMPEKKLESKERAYPLKIMTGFTFFEETSRLKGGVSIAIGSSNVTKSNPTPFSKLIKEAYPRAPNLGHYEKHNAFVGSMVAIPTKPGEAILIRAKHPYQFFSGTDNHTGMILAASDITLKGDTGKTRVQSVSNGVVRRGDPTRTVIKFAGKFRRADANVPPYLPGVFTIVQNIQTIAEDVFGLGKTDPSTWPEDCRPEPVPAQANFHTEKSRMSGTVVAAEEDDPMAGGGIPMEEDDEPIAPSDVDAAAAAKEEEEPAPKKRQERPAASDKNKKKKKAPKTAPEPEPEPDAEAEAEVEAGSEAEAEAEPVEEEEEDGIVATPVKKAAANGKSKRKRAKKVVAGEHDVPLFSIDEEERDPSDLSFRTDNTINPEFMTQPNKEAVKRVLVGLLTRGNKKDFEHEIVVGQDEEDENPVATITMADQKTNAPFVLRMYDAAVKVCGGNASLVEGLAKEARRLLGQPRFVNAAGVEDKIRTAFFGSRAIKAMTGTEFAEFAGPVAEFGKMLSPHVNRALLHAGNCTTDFRDRKDHLHMFMASEQPSYFVTVGNRTRSFQIFKPDNVNLVKIDHAPGLVVEVAAGEPVWAKIPKHKTIKTGEAEEPWAIFQFFTSDEAHATAKAGAKSKSKSQDKSKGKAAGTAVAAAAAAAPAPAMPIGKEARGKLFNAVGNELADLASKYDEKLDLPEFQPLTTAATKAQTECRKNQSSVNALWKFQDAVGALYEALTGKKWDNGRRAAPAAAAAPAKTVATKGKGKTAKSKAKSPSPAREEEEEGSESSSGGSPKKKKAGSPSAAKRAKKSASEEEREIVGISSMGETNLGAKNTLASIPVVTSIPVLHSDGKTLARRSARAVVAPKEASKQHAAIAVLEEQRREDWKKSEAANKRKSAKKGVPFVATPYEAYKALIEAKEKAARPKRGRTVRDDDDDDDDDDKEIDLEEESDPGAGEGDDDDDDDNDDDDDSDDSPFQRAENMYDAMLEQCADMIESAPENKALCKQIDAAVRAMEKKESDENAAKFISLVEQLAEKIGFIDAEGSDEEVLYGKAKRGVGIIASDAPVTIVQAGFNPDVDAKVTADFVDVLLAIAFRLTEHDATLGELKKLSLAMRISEVPVSQRFSEQAMRMFIDTHDRLLAGVKKAAPVPSVSAKTVPTAKNQALDKTLPAAKNQPLDKTLPTAKVAVPPKAEEVPVAKVVEEEEEEDDGPAPMDMEEEDEEAVPLPLPMDKDSDSESEPTVPSDEDEDEDEAPVKTASKAEAPVKTASKAEPQPQPQQEEDEEDEEDDEPQATVKPRADAKLQADAKHADPKDRLVVMPEKSPVKPKAEDVYVCVFSGVVSHAGRGRENLIETVVEYSSLSRDYLESQGAFKLAPANWRDILRSMRKDPDPQNLIGLDEAKLFAQAK